MKKTIIILTAVVSIIAFNAWMDGQEQKCLELGNTAAECARL